MEAIIRITISILMMSLAYFFTVDSIASQYRLEPIIKPFSFFLITLLSMYILFQLYIICIKKCQNCFRRGFVQAIKVKNPRYRGWDHFSIRDGSSIAVGNFCFKCRESKDWRENPAYEEFARHDLTWTFQLDSIEFFFDKNYKK